MTDPRLAPLRDHWTGGEDELVQLLAGIDEALVSKPSLRKFFKGTEDELIQQIASIDPRMQTPKRDPWEKMASDQRIVVVRDRFAGHKDRLVQFLRDACRDPANFDADAAGSDLEGLAYAGALADVAHTDLRGQRSRPKRPNAAVLLRQQREWQKRWPKAKRAGLAWEREGKPERDRLLAALREFDKAAGRRGRPMEHEKQDATLAGFLSQVYIRHTGRRPTGPMLPGDGRVQVRRHSPFSNLLAEFLAATAGKVVGIERIHQIMRQAREQGKEREILRRGS